MVTGRIESGFEAVYILDLKTRKLGAWRFDRTAKIFKPYRGRVLTSDFGAQGRAFRKRRKQTMKNTQNITIVLLLMTAAILTTLLVAGLALHPAGPRIRRRTERGGDYIMATGMYDDQTDFIYVLDVANGKLNLYYPNINTNQLTLGTTLNLATAFR